MVRIAFLMLTNHINQFNLAYNVLRHKIPNVPPDTKLSKIKTLRYATNYIRYLAAVLNDEIPATREFNPTNSNE